LKVEKREEKNEVENWRKVGVTWSWVV